MLSILLQATSIIAAVSGGSIMIFMYFNSRQIKKFDSQIEAESRLQIQQQATIINNIYFK